MLMKIEGTSQRGCSKRPDRIGSEAQSRCGEFWPVLWANWDRDLFRLRIMGELANLHGKWPLIRCFGSEDCKGFGVLWEERMWNGKTVIWEGKDERLFKPQNLVPTYPASAPPMTPNKTVYCCFYRILSQILDASTMASRKLHFFHCQQKGQALLICSKEHLTTDRCLLWRQLQMANLRKSLGMGFFTKQTYMVGHRSKNQSHFLYCITWKIAVLMRA